MVLSSSGLLHDGASELSLLLGIQRLNRVEMCQNQVRMKKTTSHTSISRASVKTSEPSTSLSINTEHRHWKWRVFSDLFSTSLPFDLLFPFFPWVLHFSFIFHFSFCLSANQRASNRGPWGSWLCDWLHALSHFSALGIGAVAPLPSTQRVALTRAPFRHRRHRLHKQHRQRLREILRVSTTKNGTAVAAKKFFFISFSF